MKVATVAKEGREWLVTIVDLRESKMMTIGFRSKRLADGCARHVNAAAWIVGATLARVRYPVS